MTTWASIDPGLGGTGVAVWLARMPSRLYRKALLSKGTLKDETKEAGIAERSSALAAAVVGLLATQCGNGLLRAYIEEPANMGGGVAARRGDLVKLALTAGAIATAIKIQFPRCKVIMVPVIQWKGNAPKEITNRRVCELMGWPQSDIKKQNHELDAVGIGLHALGIFR
jgi:hypothetical protein